MAAIKFRRRHFQVHFLEWKLLNFKENLTEMCSLGSDSQHARIGSDNGLAPNRRQAIIWTNYGLGYWRIYAPFALNEFRTRRPTKHRHTHKKKYKKLRAGTQRWNVYLYDTQIQCGYVSASTYIKVPPTLEPACLLIDPTSMSDWFTGHWALKYIL